MSNDKIVWIDLGEKCVELRSAKDYDSEVYIGGRGLATRIYWEEATSDANTFSPSSPLILMSGLAVGTGIKGATRMVIVGKSALKGWFCYGNLGGFFPALLRKAGFLGLVIRGVSEKPCYIFLCGDRIEIHEAQDLWGRNTQEVIKVLKKRFGPGTEVLTIGKAGENLVSFSTIVSSHQSSASGGLGAVMGSKKLKAIVVKKTPVNKLYTDRKLCLLNDYIYQVSNRIRLSIPPKIVATGKEGLIKVIGNGSCYGCNLKCIRGRYLYEGGFKGYRKCQAMEYYLPWLYGKEDEPLETLFLAPVLANDYGMCTFELEHIIDWLYLCYKEGALSEKEAGLPLSEIGRGFFLNRLLEALCERRGLGNILARGLENASEVLSSGPREIFERLMKPISKHVYIPVRDLDEARGHLVNMLLYQFEPRRHRPLLHQGFTLVAWQLHTNNPSISPISYEIYKKICEIFWGSELAADDSTYEGKRLAAVKIQNRIYAIDSLGLCSFAYPITYSLSTEDNVGDPDAEAKILSALKGISLEDAQILLEQCGSKTVELQRKILQKEGWELPDSDYPPRFHFEEPLPPNIIGHKFIIPGRNGEPVLPTGSTLDESGYRRMLQEYYDLLVHGSSERPVYIFIREGEAEIRDAQHLWGKSVTEVCSIITKELGRGNKVLTIGQAGENLVSFATLCTDDGASGSGGLGSVMGSKKLKAIVLAGDKWRPEVALPEKLGKLVDQIFYLRGRHFAYRHKWEHEGKTKRRGCVGCISVCARQYYRLSDKKWVKFFCQMADVYEEAVISHYGKWNEVVVEATELSQEYGIDTFVLEPMIYWLKKCYHEGVIDEQKIRLPLSKIGTREFFEKLLKAISYKEDFGEILAEGTLKAAELLGENSQELIGDLIATEANDLSVYDPRLFIAHALLYALEPRKPISALHEMSMVVHEWEGLKGIGIQQNPGGDFLSGEDVLAIAEKFWGSADAGDFSTYKGKALAAIKIQNRTCVKESLGLCDFMWPLIFVRRQDHVGIPDLENQVLSAIRGEEVTSEELEKIGERVFNLQRLILLKEGWRGREDDSLRNAFFDIPLGSARFNPECLVPGPNGKPCSRRGAKIEKTSFETMKDEYYKLRGWSMRGVPLESKLTELFKHSVELCNTSLMLHSTL